MSVTAQYGTVDVARSYAPTDQNRADREPRADRRQQDQVSLLQASRLHRVVERQGNRRGRGVAVLVDVDNHLLLGHPDLLGGRQDDALVGLMRDEEVEIVAGKVVSPQQPLAD